MTYRKKKKQLIFNVCIAINFLAIKNDLSLPSLEFIAITSQASWPLAPGEFL